MKARGNRLLAAASVAALAALAGGASRFCWNMERHLAELSRQVRGLADAPAVAGAVAGTCVAQLDGDAVAAHVARLLRQDRVDATPSAAALAPPAASGEPPPAPPATRTPAMAAALERGRELVVEARSTGHWQPEHAASLRGIMGALDGAGSSQLLSELAQAINSQQIAIDGPRIF